MINVTTGPDDHRQLIYFKSIFRFTNSGVSGLARRPPLHYSIVLPDVLIINVETNCDIVLSHISNAYII